VGVALDLAELGVTEDLPDDSDADALVKKERRGRMPGSVHPGCRLGSCRAWAAGIASHAALALSSDR
jgi:hypothetical protein